MVRHEVADGIQFQPIWAPFRLSEITSATHYLTSCLAGASETALTACARYATPRLNTGGGAWTGHKYRHLSYQVCIQSTPCDL